MRNGAIWRREFEALRLTAADAERRGDERREVRLNISLRYPLRSSASAAVNIKRQYFQLQIEPLSADESSDLPELFPWANV